MATKKKKRAPKSSGKSKAKKNKNGVTINAEFNLDTADMKKAVKKVKNAAHSVKKAVKKLIP